jgi:hypothetical protein
MKSSLGPTLVKLFNVLLACILISATATFAAPPEHKEWLSCNENSDCTAVLVGCYQWVPVNMTYAADRAREGEVYCKKSIEPGNQPNVDCMDHFCKTSMAHVSLTLENEKIINGACYEVLHSSSLPVHLKPNDQAPLIAECPSWSLQQSCNGLVRTIYAQSKGDWIGVDCIQGDCYDKSCAEGGGGHMDSTKSKCPAGWIRWRTPNGRITVKPIECGVD